MQRILTVSSSLLEPLYALRGFHDAPEEIAFATSALHDCGHYVDREIAENDSSLRQIVACALIRNSDSILCLKRSKKTERPVLRLKHSVLVGGHVDEQDSTSEDPLRNCIRRELAEELSIIVETPLQLLGIITDPATHVGSIHVGFVFDVVVNYDEIDVDSYLDDAEFINAGKSKTLTFTPISRISALIGSLDPWSELLVTSSLFRQLTGMSWHAERGEQRYLKF